jgi:Transglutaminase-like superfamily
METNISYIVCGLIIFFSILTSIKSSIEERSVKYSADKLFYYFSIFISFFILITNLEELYLGILRAINAYTNLENFNNSLFKVLALSVVFILIQNIIYLILKFLNSIILNPYNYKKEGKLSIIIFSSIFGFLKGLVIILMMFLVIGTYNISFGINNKIKIFENINGYNSLEEVISVNKPILSYEDFKEFLPTDANIIVYYNGVTLEDGIKSNEEIDAKALEIIRGSSSDREKARKLYAWVGSNIIYDFNKAEKVLNEEGINNSGAVEAYNTRRGICFDYACLYTAMGKAVGLGTRIVTGDAFDGTNYGPHAWNQVYLEDEGIWINVDPTFYMAGDYFDNEDFYLDHLNPQIAGEF